MDKELINIQDDRTRYTKILEYISHYLKEKIKIYDMCDFHQDKCIANRLHKSIEKCNGCCYHLRKGLCSHLTPNGCSIESVSCQLFICHYLERIYGKIKLEKIFPVKKVFNRRQIEIIKRSYFKDKEEIVALLMEAKKK